MTAMTLVRREYDGFERIFVTSLSSRASRIKSRLPRILGCIPEHKEPSSDRAAGTQRTCGSPIESEKRRPTDPSRTTAPIERALRAARLEKPRPRVSSAGEECARSRAAVCVRACMSASM